MVSKRAEKQRRRKHRMLNRQRRIAYRLIEGDLDKFEGEWNFERTAEGTRVTLTVDGRRFDEGFPGVSKARAGAGFDALPPRGGSFEEVGFGTFSRPGRGGVLFNLVELSIGTGDGAQPSEASPHSDPR